MSREYSENVLVQNSAGNLLQNVLGWEVVMAYNSEKLGPDGTLGRTSYGEVLLTRYFRQALLRLNPWLTPNQLDEVQKKFTAHVSTASLMQINEEKYFLLRDGIPVTVQMEDIIEFMDESRCDKLLQRHLRKSINIHSIPAHKQSKCLDLFRLTVRIGAI